MVLSLDRDLDSILPPEAQAVVFNVDGTLFDSNDQRVTGKSGHDIVRELCCEQGVQLDQAAADELVDAEGRYFREQLAQVKPVGVVLRLVREAQRRRMKLAVASGGQRNIVDQMIHDFGLQDCFSVVISSKDVENSKPAPDIFRLAADQLGVPPDRCVALEDAPMGLQAARAAGYLLVVDVTEIEGHPELGLHK